MGSGILYWPMEKIRIFHCADLHLGLRFSRYPEGLAEARFTSLERMVATANTERCDLFVVAGDLFDHLSVAKRDVARAAKILSGFEKVVCVLPGNHDFHSGAADDFWKSFEAGERGKLVLLEEGRSYSLKEHGLDAVIYAAPCTSKYSSTHALGWISSRKDRPEGLFQIGVAHGSFEGLSPDLQGDYFPMKKADLDRCELDLWLLGHIHVQFPPRTPGAHDRIFYSGTHEPDGFDCRHEGKAWLLELSRDKTLSAKSLSTGQFRFREEEVELHSLAALDELSRRFADGEAARTLLKLRLTGSLGREEHGSFGAALERLKKRFFFLKADFSQLSVRLAPEDIDRAFAQESFPHRLLTALAADPSDREALQVAFELVQETQQTQAAAEGRA